MRGPNVWRVLQGDHRHTKRDADPALRKEWELGDYKYWAGRGATPEACVEAMRAERAKGMTWLCGFCHALEKTTSAANKYEDPATMPKGKRSGTKEERAQYDRRRHAMIIFPKQRFVDWFKRTRCKRCAFCKRKVREGEEHAFVFDHLDELTKMKDNPVTKETTLAGKTGGVAGLVNNSAKATVLVELFDLLLEEIRKCQLLCWNCNHCKTYGYPLCG